MVRSFCADPSFLDMGKLSKKGGSLSVGGRGATINLSPWTCGYSGFLEKSSFGSKVLSLQEVLQVCSRAEYGVDDR